MTSRWIEYYTLVVPRHREEANCYLPTYVDDYRHQWIQTFPFILNLLPETQNLGQWFRHLSTKSRCRIRVIPAPPNPSVPRRS